MLGEVTIYCAIQRPSHSADWKALTVRDSGRDKFRALIRPAFSLTAKAPKREQPIERANFRYGGHRRLKIHVHEEFLKVFLSTYIAQIRLIQRERDRFRYFRDERQCRNRIVMNDLPWHLLGRLR